MRDTIVAATGLPDMYDIPEYPSLGKVHRADVDCQGWWVERHNLTGLMSVTTGLKFRAKWAPHVEYTNEKK